MADDSEKPPSTNPEPQTSNSSDNTPATIETTNNASTDAEPPEDLLEVAREFLKDASIRNAPTDDKIQYLKDKGLRTDAIAKLLAEGTERREELKTVHDTTSSSKDVSNESNATPAPIKTLAVAKPASNELKKDMPPIITYPEFLLKPQKPPPLITVSRLANAAYVVAGVSALTWGASKYIIDPMRQTLTEARHDFAGSTLHDLEEFNEKLEGMVSHVPYIATSAVKRQQEREEDIESVDSDPTELFHRDIATQTTPGLSRSSSEASLSRYALDPTIAQAERLSGLSYSLRSLVQSLDHANDNEKYMKKTINDFQQKIDNMESSYSLLKNDYYNSNSIYSSASSDAKKASAREVEAQKFKQEIRALKGAFLSSRNFPSATRPQTTSAGGGYGPR